MKYRFALIIFVAIVIIAVSFVVLTGGFSNHLTANVTKVEYIGNSFSLPPLVCGGIATNEWYLYSTSSSGPFANETVGQCAVSSSPSCSFPAGYYAC